jgi:hypothetical protein
MLALLLFLLLVPSLLFLLYRNLGHHICRCAQTLSDASDIAGAALIGGIHGDVGDLDMGRARHNICGSNEKVQNR